ncbi:hypothetical protein AAFC00_006990 [Neodothiora populina]|uniref:BTB domain-containing protein n=1 Tax=Neodothiora populina TaxID=2781224 RepID=A0ABR3PBU9_9PEZI
MPRDASYADGVDTIIELSFDRRMLAHSETLKEGSALFERLLAKEGPVLSPYGCIRGRRYHLVLHFWDPLTIRAVDPEIRRVDVDSNGQPTTRVWNLYEDEIACIDAKVYDAIEKILESYYGKRVEIDCSSIDVAMQEALELMKWAEYLGSVHSIASFIESSLLSMGQPLYAAIADQPIEWLDLAYRMKSKNIFREALIHLTGRYNHFQSTRMICGNKYGLMPTNTKLDDIRPVLRGFVTKKVTQLRDKCRAIDEALVSFYPAQMQRVSESGRADTDDIGRQSYAGDVYWWQALCIFRQYLGQSLAGDHTHKASDNGYQFYNDIRQGKEYLTRDKMGDFHAIFPMSNKGKAALYSRVEGTRNLARRLVEPLFVNNSCLAPSNNKKHFTCIVVTNEDYPWLNNAVDEWAAVDPSIDPDNDDMLTFGSVSAQFGSVAPAGDLTRDAHNDDDGKGDEDMAADEDFVAGNGDVMDFKVEGGESDGAGLKEETDLDEESERGFRLARQQEAVGRVPAARVVRRH